MTEQLEPYRPPVSKLDLTTLFLARRVLSNPMEQTNSSETDPPEIRRRLECIQDQRALIEDLATRLKSAQLEYDRLEKELNAYRASIAPIRKCPEEVLLMIFEAFSEDAPELVVGLLQVCKRWHDVAINAPRLWTHIRIKVEPTWNQEEGAQRDQAHITACLEHSTSLPLHISVDLTEMLNTDSQMSGFIEELLRGGCDNDICSWARRYVYKLDDDVDVHLGYMCEEYGPDNVLRTISELVGDDGRHMDRWKTLHISLPSYYHEKEISAIWRLFRYPTPRLTKLFISGRGLSQRYLSPGTPGSVIFPDLSSLEDLTLGGSKITDLDFLRLTFPSVKRLEMETNIHNSLQLSRFTNLEYLDILFNEAPTNATSALEVIHLPCLRDLTLHVYGSTKVEWHVPILKRLGIVGWIGGELKALPTVRASHVCWTLGQPHYTTEIESSLLRTLEAIISEYGEMQKVSIQTSLKPIWDEYVQGLNEGKCLALPVVDFRWEY